MLKRKKKTELTKPNIINKENEESCNVNEILMGTLDQIFKEQQQKKDATEVLEKC